MSHQTLTAITPDIYQVRLPLPFALRIINSYVLRGQQGWTIVDTGLNTAESRATWHSVFDALNITPDTIQQIVLTHTHPDHYGMAGWLQQLSHAPVRLSQREAELAEAVWGEPAGWREGLMAFWQECGLPAELAAALVQNTDETRQHTLPHPKTVETISPGSSIQLGDRWFQAIHAPGHSDGQLIFYETADSLMLCGDHVLQKISPNISLWPQSSPNPLQDYLNSLQTLSALPVRLALPGHGRPITAWAERIAELLQHHEERLKKLETAVSTHTLTVYQASQHLFDFTHLTTHEIRFAVAETLAHLVYLQNATTTLAK